MRTYLALFSLILTACSRNEPVVADRVLVNGTIFTADSSQPWAEAIAMRGTEFVYVGDAEGAEEYRGGNVEVTDLGGRVVIPGIVDGHTHPGQIDLVQYDATFEAGGREAFLAELEAFADSDAGDGWLRACCWRVIDFVDGDRGPDRVDLDRLFPERPVWIVSDAGHSSWLNSLALRRLGIDEDSEDPRFPIAMYKRDEDGRPTGWIKEGAAWQRMEEVFPIDRTVHEASMRAMLGELSEHGVTTLYDAGNKHGNDAIYGFFADLERSGELPLRIEGTYRISTPDRLELAISEMKRFREAYAGERLRFNAIKLFMDGVHENRSGAQLEPYADDPGYRSDTTLTVGQLRDYLLRLHEEQFDLHVHTIGDLAVKRVLDAVELAQAEVGETFYPRVTLAHLQNVDPGDWPRFAELGVSANFTPWWLGADQPDPVAAGLGPQLANDTYRVRALMEAGGNVTFSSDDWRLGYLSPFLGMQVGHSRQYPREWLDGDDDPDLIREPASDKLPLEMLLTGYTINGAYQLRMEERIGSIEPGKSADFVILEADFFESDPYEIHATKPRAVVMEGKVVQGSL